MFIGRGGRTAFVEEKMKRAFLSAILSTLVLGVLQAEEPVYFADPTLKAAVEETLWEPDPTPTDMLDLLTLTSTSSGITTLTGLEYAVNLCYLNVRVNEISDLSPLAGLIQMRTLVLNNNRIMDLSPLSGLCKLEFLDIHQSGIADLSGLEGLANLWHLNAHDNRISDISLLSGLTSLQQANLSINQIVDISPLGVLTSLTSLDLRKNPLNQEAYDMYIPRIIANNPGIDIAYSVNGTTPTSELGVFISAGQGGHVVQPGEGQFTYKYNDVVCLQAQADPGFVFTHWSGTIYISENPYCLIVRGNHQITASFAAVSSVLHVEDDAPDDPAPSDPAESDPLEDGTAEHPFDRIQEAIDTAVSGDSIRVCSGTYREIIDLLGKTLDLKGVDPEDPNQMGWPVIDAMGDGPVVSVSCVEEQPTCMLTGFVLTGGKHPLAAAVSCSRASLTLANCLIVGNCTGDLAGAILYCQDSNAVLVNCTIADNLAGDGGAALSAVDSNVRIRNSILWGNIGDEVVTGTRGCISVSYSDIAGVCEGSACIHFDPLFARAGVWVDADDPNTVLGPDDPSAIWVMGDYHLQSETGRWNSETDGWAQDAATSPCIDAGDPTDPVGPEPSPNAGIINLGAYGGTSEASRSSSDS